VRGRHVHLLECGDGGVLIQGVWLPGFAREPQAFLFICAGRRTFVRAVPRLVPIWINHLFFFASSGLSPALVNVALQRGCGNTKSTFTPGVDKVTMQIKFR
jgi:hypothetical protein